METWQILVTVGVPSGIFGFAVWLIERKIEQHERKRTEEAKKRENIEAQREKSREELQICIYETSLAAIALGEATAKAVQRIPDAHCNGDMHAALDYASKVKHAQREVVSDLQKIHRYVDIALKEDAPQQSKTRNHNIDR